MNYIISSIWLAAFVLLVTADALVPAGGQVQSLLGFQRRLYSFQNGFGSNMRLYLRKKEFMSSTECSIESKCDFVGGEDSKQKSNLLPLFIVPLVWGTYSPIVKSVYSSSSVLPPPVLIFNLSSYLVSFCSLLLAGLLGEQRQLSRVNETDIVADSPEREDLEPRVGIELGIYLFMGSMLQVYGIQQVSATKAAVLVQCTTILVPLLESLLYKKNLVKVYGLLVVQHYSVCCYSP